MFYFHVFKCADTRVFIGDTVTLFLATRSQHSGNVSKHLFLESSLSKALASLEKRLVSQSLSSLTFTCKGCFKRVYFCVATSHTPHRHLRPLQRSTRLQPPSFCKGEGYDSSHFVKHLGFASFSATHSSFLKVRSNVANTRNRETG